MKNREGEDNLTCSGTGKMTSAETILYEPKSHESAFQRNLLLGIGLVLLVLGAVKEDYLAVALGVGSAIFGIRPFKDKRKILIKNGSLHYKLGWMSEKQFQIEDVEKMEMTFSSREDQNGSVDVERYYCFELNSGEKVYLPNVLTSDKESVLMELFKNKLIKE
jgi:hypothetical protein